MADPDPNDWLRDDDVKVKCLLSNAAPTLSPQGWICAGNPYVTVACRPYKLREECETPEWCPQASPASINK